MALIRPGRLDRILYVGPPDTAARAAIFSVNFRKMSIAKDINVQELTDLTQGCSGAEIVSICQDAAIKAMAESFDAEEVHHCHLLASARTVRRRITPETLRAYEQWRDQVAIQNV